MLPSEPQNKCIDLEVQDVVHAHIVENVALTQRYVLTAQYMMAAARFARNCGAIERKNVGRPLGPFFDEILQFATASITFSAFSLESHLNDIVSDAKSAIKYEPIFAALKRKNDSSLMASKYNEVLKANSVATFDENSLPYIAVEVLVNFRNRLVHFEPHSSDDQKAKNLALGERLRSRFPLSPFVPDGHGPIFPLRCMSHAATVWAITTARDFMREFDNRMGRVHYLDLHSDDLATE
jgi:hypothetical protein